VAAKALRMIRTHNLGFSYSPQKTFAFPDISCEDREALLILGRSGTGKTTFLHLLALLLRAEKGEVIVNGQNIAPLSVAEAAAVRAAQIGIIYQRAHFIRSLSVLDNLLISNYLANKQQNKARARQLAEALGFADHLSKPTHQLSQGEQQRVSIARALMNNPGVILADEPTSSLDDLNCQRVIDLLKTQSEQIGASLVVVTHDQRLKDVFNKQVAL
jgi:lipoprotein-releasing system ATP-binding protein